LIQFLIIQLVFKTNQQFSAPRQLKH